MSANSIDSDQYVDGSIDAAHLAPAQTNITSVGTLTGLTVNKGSGTLSADLVTVQGGGASGNYNAFVVKANNGDELFKVNASSYDAFLPNASSNLYIGQATSSGVRGIDNKVQVSGPDLAGSSIALHRYQANAYGPYLHFAKSRHASIGSHTIVQDGDVVGTLGFYPSDGSDFVGHCAEIQVQVDGTPGTDDIPGRIIFKTTADGAVSATERMRIDSSGNLNVLTGTIKENNIPTRSRSFVMALVFG